MPGGAKRPNSYKKTKKNCCIIGISSDELVQFFFFRQHQNRPFCCPRELKSDWLINNSVAYFFEKSAFKGHICCKGLIQQPPPFPKPCSYQQYCLLCASPLFKESLNKLIISAMIKGVLLTGWLRSIIAVDQYVEHCVSFFLIN